MNDFPTSHILTLTGPPRERGRMHGEIMRPRIQELMSRWKETLSQEGCNPLGQYLQDLVSETNFMPAIQRWTPDLLEEVRGIAEGSGVDFPTIFAFQLQDEEWWFRQDKWQALHGGPRGCSSVGWQREPGSPSLVAQNMDMPDYLDGCQVILHIKEEHTDVKSVVFSVAGLIALNGINNHSIGIVCNNLSQLNHSRDGLPVAFVLRGVLARRSFTEAKSFLKTVPHASGQNYILGSRTRVIDFECSANQVAEYSQPAHRRSVCHTNHPFSNTDIRHLSEGIKSIGDGPDEVIIMKDINSRIRFDVVYKQLGAVESSREANFISTKRMLSSHDSTTHPVCRHSSPGNEWMTLGTSIMSLDEHPRMHVCPGPPCTSRFTQFSLN